MIKNNELKKQNKIQHIFHTYPNADVYSCSCCIREVHHLVIVSTAFTSERNFHSAKMGGSSIRPGFAVIYILSKWFIRISEKRRLC